MKIVPIGFSAVAFAGETSCFLLQDDDGSILLDAGTNPAFSLAQLGYSTIDLTAVYVSHVHADHMQGLPSLIFTRSVQARSAEREVPPLAVVAAPDVLSVAQQLVTLLYPERQFPVDWLEANTAAPVIGPFTLEAFRVDHAVPSFGVSVLRGSRKVCSYTSDTALCDEVVRGCSDSQALIVECFGTTTQFGQLAAGGKHMCAADASQLAAIVKPDVAVPYHMHAPYRDPAKRQSLLEELHSVFPGPWEYPEVGKPIEIPV